MRYAFVGTNLLDMRAKPDFHSERVNQLFFGAPVSVTSTRGDYAHVDKPGGYSGWVRTSLLTPLTVRDYRAALEQVSAIVRSAGANIYVPDRNRRPEPFFLYYGTPLNVISWRGGNARVRLPNGALLRVRQSCLRRLPSKATRPLDITGAMLVKEAKRFLGVPYLWGGVTVAGFDCSGLVQTVCAQFGLALPRDTKDQISIGKEIPREDIRSGDLLFFDRHVGFAMSKQRLIHSSVGGGGVRINALVPNGEDYREDLDHSFVMARRIV